MEKYPEIYLITANENRSLISKAGSDAKVVARIDVNQRPGGTTERFYELLPITSALPDDLNTNGVIASYETRLCTAPTPLSASHACRSTV